MTSLRIIHPQPGLSHATASAIFALTSTVWPPKEGAPKPNSEEVLARLKAKSPAHFIIDDSENENSVLAHAMIFRREIFTAQGPQVVGALAGVCVHPDYRGRGWGADVVRAAFDYLPELGVEVSLFQTGVPSFYEKLGARLVTNSFFDGTRADGIKENPFWEPYAMIYPASVSWPDGEIDLNGAGY